MLINEKYAQFFERKYQIFYDNSHYVDKSFNFGLLEAF